LNIMELRDVFKDEFIEGIVVDFLKEDLDMNEDTNLVNALHTVIAYYSVPGEYEDGKYDNFG